MFKGVFMMILTLLLAACASIKPQANQPAAQERAVSPGNDKTVKPSSVEIQPLRADLEDLGPAPELMNEVWLNTDQPLRLEDLGGKVVLLDMWTFG